MRPTSFSDLKMPEAYQSEAYVLVQKAFESGITTSEVDVIQNQLRALLVDLVNTKKQAEAWLGPRPPRGSPKPTEWDRIQYSPENYAMFEDYINKQIKLLDDYKANLKRPSN